jgi:hypothetical protein
MCVSVCAYVYVYVRMCMFELLHFTVHTISSIVAYLNTKSSRLVAYALGSPSHTLLPDLNSCVRLL